jgi:O-antigen ligase
MGKKSRQKKLQNQTLMGSQNASLASGAAGLAEHLVLWEKVLLLIVKIAVYLSLLTPFILFNNFYFPFVGVKSLYFMAFCQVAFFAWLILAISNKNYRPKLNSVLVTFVLFVATLAVSGLVGADFSQSFWSKFERMTGLLMWFHLLGFFLAVSCCFKRSSEWKKLFLAAVFVAFLFSSLSTLEVFATKNLKILERTSQEIASSTVLSSLRKIVFSDRGGLTLGNTSYVGSYLIFNIFLALYLFLSPVGVFESRRLTWALRIFSGLAAALAILSLHFNEARAAFFAAFGGILLIALLWLCFGSVKKSNWLRFLKWPARIILALAVLAAVASIVLLYLPNNPIHDRFGQMGGNARFVNWAIAEQGFLERPVLGWGPENYILVFPKFFNTCLFLPQECGGEIWFDRAHNIIVDTLVTTGVLGLLAYLGIFFGVFWALAQAYFKQKTIDFWLFGVVLAVLAAYFIQNLTVFDMVVSLMFFVLILGFVSSVAKSGDAESANQLARKEPAAGLMILIGGAFLICFLLFIIQPLKADNLVIRAMQKDMEVASYANALAKDVLAGQPLEKPVDLNQTQQIDLTKFIIAKGQEKLELSRQALGSSALGKYQIREFFAQQFETFLQSPPYVQYVNLPPNFQYAIWQNSTSSFDYLIEQMQKGIKESPLDYRSLLRLGDITSLYGRINSDKLFQASQILQKAIELSPQNQQTYWLLAQNEVWLAQFAIKNNEADWNKHVEEALQYGKLSQDLNKKVWNSSQIILQILTAGQNMASEKKDMVLVKKYSKQLNEEADAIIKFNPQWETQVKGFLQQ